MLPIAVTIDVCYTYLVMLLYSNEAGMSYLTAVIIQLLTVSVSSGQSSWLQNRDILCFL
jgi:hypothetical protein